jgi:hypothetical protein
MAAVINTAKGSLPDRAKLMKIMRRYGLTPFTPSSSLATQAVNYLIQCQIL